MTRRTVPIRRRRDPRPGTGKVVDGDGGRPRVVVVGGGFAGLPTVRELSGADVDVLLLDQDLYNTFQPLLYQVATGGLSPGDVTYALRAFAARFGNAQFRRMTVTGLDAARRCVRTDTSEEVVQLPRAVKLKGRVAWLAWVTLRIVTLVGHRNRLATLANLSVRYLAWPGRLNVVVGDPP
jgi:NADH dehydrogenase FAD-containing subunit